MDSTNFKEIRTKLVTDSNNYMESFRQNVRMYDLPLTKLSQIADVPYDTLKSFLYGDSTDCKLSLAVKLAKALGCSIDELVGADTLPAETRNSMAMLGLLPPHFLKFVRWAIRKNFDNLSLPDIESTIEVMIPKYDNNMIATGCYEVMDIDAPSDILGKTVLGIQIPCDEYMPHYYEGDIILIANDRKPKDKEHLVVHIDKSFWIVRQDKNEHRTLNDNRINNNGTIVGYICFVERK